MTFRLTAHPRTSTACGTLAVLALLLPALTHAQTTVPQQRTELTLYVGGGRWLPRPAPGPELDHNGGRVLAGLQVEHPVGGAGWAVAASVARAGFPLGTTGLRPVAGWLYDVAATRRWTTRGGLAFAFVGAGPAVVTFDERRVAASVRGGVGLGTRVGLRVEGRQQHLFGAEEPRAYSVTLGVHGRW